MQNALGLAEGFVSSVYVEALRWAATMLESEVPG
jgi:hypothetical protein